ncbi:hypothetical protein GGX14DRAFT_623191 [Mycena pura]|uniref:Prolyl 4-hydroxylase alpha subunit Fe(2+) 2OG dioxygenase domain-containing protein n=1 Tax=Mycena pura TaxID=153505 RepID=A0AAD6VN30_9AGAR|nr:hypothetical protein GGX14DRAFT_623191 [Mycena pura]
MSHRRLLSSSSGLLRNIRKMPATWSFADHLNVLRDSLKITSPYTCGVHPVRAEDLTLYYKTGNDAQAARFIQFGKAPEAQLLELAAACQPATFGVDQKDVLDETYRKAVKMDNDKFASSLDIAASGILKAISPDLLDGQQGGDEKALRAELYKLNIYGPGSFFKAHKDTPRSDDMIGSLVIVFPTAHEGGALTLSHGKNTWAFDSAAELAAYGQGSSFWLARHLDLFNLFLANHTAGAVHPPASAPERACETALRALLADPAFFPDGGLLAFSLTHQYPIPARAERSSLARVLQMLKGSDARIRTAAERVGLSTVVRFAYESEDRTQYYGKGRGNDVLVDHVLELQDSEMEDLRAAVESEGKVLSDFRVGGKKRGHDEDDDASDSETTAVHWVTDRDRTSQNRVDSAYVYYGNEAYMGHVYGNAALFVSIPKVGEGVRRG